MKWLLIGLITFVVLVIATGYMGGARDAAANYNKLRGMPSS